MDFKTTHCLKLQQKLFFGVKVGSGLQINNEGILSTTGGGIADAVAWENVTNKPTTLAGYGITDVKISGKVITLGTSSITVPSKTSEITNDSGFITKIPIASSSVLGGIKVGANLLVSGDGTLSAEKVPTKVSQLQNDSKFQTDTQVQSSINNAISGITSFDYQIVSQLPQLGKKGTIYLVSKSGAGKDVYDEYIWVTDKFELIGTTAVDLTGYVKNTDLVAISNDEIDQILAS